VPSEDSFAAVVVAVDRLTRTFQAPLRRGGLKVALTSLFHQERQTITAVDDVSFSVSAGQVVGLIGPNGAGKTTTMKMLAGVLHPSSGRAEVLGFRPYDRDREYLRSIALIRGSQPIGGPGELTVMDNFGYRRLLYDIARKDFDEHLAELEAMLDLSDVMARQVRALSLGQRMRAGLALALLHRPRALFLDEPTIGLDASAALAFRRYVGRYAATTGATVILTSHYMTEVEALCSRVILIDHGAVRFDGNLRTLAATLSPWKEIRISRPPDAGKVDWDRYGENVTDALGDAGDVVSLRVPRDRVPAVTADLLNTIELTDLSVTDPPLEVVLDRYYRDDEES